jgi:surfactin synthase thioesterase subunit
LNVIYAIPGLGTTSALFQEIKIKNYEVRVLDWPETAGCGTLKDYSKKFIPQIDQTKPFSLMGVSFGGMLCVELSLILQPQHLILISSCSTPSELPSQFNFIRFTRLYYLFNDAILRRVAKLLYRPLGFKLAYKKEFFNMIDSMKPGYFRACIKFMLQWKSCKVQANMLHIHGIRDKVLPHQYIRNFIPIKDGNHAMVLYKAKEINAILEKKLNGL